MSKKMELHMNLINVIDLNTTLKCSLLLDMIALIMICNFHSVCLYQHGNYGGDYLCLGTRTVELMHWD